MITYLESEEYLRTVGNGPEQGFNIAKAALQLAVLNRRKYNILPIEKHLEDMASQVASHITFAQIQSAEDAAITLAKVISHKNGYTGDYHTYHDLKNADLISVIERRKGLPVALGILYIHIARLQGWAAFGLNFPGHFLISLEFQEGQTIIDPFHNGTNRKPSEIRELLKLMVGKNAELSTDMLARVSDRRILLRLQSNIRLRQLQMHRLGDAAKTIASMLLIAPKESQIWRDAGIINAKLGNLGDAIGALVNSIERDQNPSRRNGTTKILEGLRRQLH